MARTTKDTKTQAPAPATQQELQAAGQQPPATTDKKPSASERFTKMVMQQYQSMGAYNFTNRERQLIRNYFICIDQMLQRTEAERLRRTRTPGTSMTTICRTPGPISIARARPDLPITPALVLR